jgi:hypothetical protein
MCTFCNKKNWKDIFTTVFFSAIWKKEASLPHPVFAWSHFLNLENIPSLYVKCTSKSNDYTKGPEYTSSHSTVFRLYCCNYRIINDSCVQFMRSECIHVPCYVYLSPCKFEMSHYQYVNLHAESIELSQHDDSTLDIWCSIPSGGRNFLDRTHTGSVAQPISYPILSTWYL